MSAAGLFGLFIVVARARSRSETPPKLSAKSSLKIRTALPADAALLLDFVEQVNSESKFLTAEPGEFEMTEEEETNFVRDIVASSNQVFFLGFIGDKLISTCMVLASQTRVRLQHRGVLGISVARAYWGQGIGGAMLDHLIAWAKNNPILTKLDLDTRADNKRAIVLYRSRGFVKEGRLRNNFYVDGQYYDAYTFKTII